MRSASLTIAIAVLLLSIATNNFSATPKTVPRSMKPAQPDWPHEPSSFMGIEFGRPLSEQIPKCPTQKIGSMEMHDYQGTMKLGQPCYTTLLNFRELHNYPNLGVLNESPTILMVGEAPEGMTFRLPHYNWQKMLDILKAKYGEPTLIDSESYSTRGGMKVTGGVYTWKGKLVTLNFHEYGDTVDKSVVHIETQRRVDQSQDDSKRNAQIQKGKL